MVDDKATLPIQNINRQFTAMGNQFTAVQGKVNSFNSAINTNSKTFTASANAIKTQGNALTNLNTNLKTTSTTSATLGTKIKGTATQFAGFATGMAATSSGVLQLAAGFRDYSDAQIAVDRVTRKNSLAQEALGKAQDKLKKITDTGVRSGKAYEAALLDVNQAQQMASIQSDLLGEAQERLFDSQTQFVASVIPTTLGAIGTLGMAFRELGGTKGMGGLVDKFKGFGGGIKGSVIPAIASLTGAGGLGGLIEKMKGAGTSAVGLKGNLLGLGITTAVIGGVTFAAIELGNAMNKLASHFSNVKQPVSALESTLDKSGKSLKTWNLTVAETEAAARAGVSPAIFAMDAVFGTHMTENILRSAGALDKHGKIIVNFDGKAKTLGTTVTALSTAEAKLATDEEKLLALQKERQTIGVKQQEAELKITIDQDKAEIARLTTVQKVNDLKGKSNILSQEELNIIGRANEAKQQQIDWQIKLAGAYEEVMLKTKASADDAKRQADAVKLWNDAITNIIPNMIKLTDAGAQAQEAIKLVGDMVKLTKDRMIEWSPAAGASADIMSTIDGVLAGLPAKQATWTNSIQANSKALEDAKKKLDDFKKGLEAAQTNIKGVFKIDSNADKILKNLIKSLPNKAEKEIKLKLKFGQSIDDNKKAFNDLLFEATQVSDKTADASAKQIIETIDKKFKGAKGQFAGLRAALKTAIADPNTPEALKTLLMNFNWDAVGTTAGSKIGAGVKSGIAAIANQGGGLASLWEGAGGKGIVIPAPVTAAFDTGIKTVQTSATTAVTNISTSLAEVSAVSIPPPNESTYQKGLQLAINNAGQTVKIITSTLKKIASIQVPPPNESKYQKGLQLAINNAGQTVKLISKELGKIGSIKVPAPKFNNFNSALDQAVSDAKRAVRDINNALTKIKKPSSGGGGTGQQGAYGGSKGDTSGLFVGGSKSDSGGGGGDTIINVHVMDETIMRRITARSGRGRFTMGA